MANYQLSPLPFSTDALELYIDQKTMEIHHGKHHQTYVDKLNGVLEGFKELSSLSLEELLSDLDQVPASIRTAVRNNGGGHYNHQLFWEILTPEGSKEPIGEVKVAIEEQYGSYEDFKVAFKSAALTRFGSGWVWLVIDENKKLSVVHTANQDNPIMEGRQVVLGLDVWEHAYYLKYQNKRPDYVDAFFQVINWEIVNKKYQHAINK